MWSSSTPICTCAVQPSSSGRSPSSGGPPPYLLDWYKRWPTENPAVISLTGNPSPELMTDLDPALVGRSDPRELRATMTDNIGGRHVNWVIVAAPNPGWATEVFGEPDVERLWEAVAIATRLDEPDPVAAWRAHIESLQARADALNARAFDAIRFRGPGTDLTVGLVPGARWRCAAFETARGITHVPNLPTEEVFTSPDWRRAEGHVRSTYPLVTSGTKVTGLEFRFEGGQDRRRRRPSRVPRSCARNSPRTSRRRTSASSRSWTAPHP